jgi:hypothetical protein
MQNTSKEGKKGRKKRRSTSDMWVYAQICVAPGLLAVETGIANININIWG